MPHWKMTIVSQCQSDNCSTQPAQLKSERQKPVCFLLLAIETIWVEAVVYVCVSESVKD